MKRLLKSRRKLLQLTATTLGATLLPSQAAKADKINEASQKPESDKTQVASCLFFDARQRQLVDELTETIIPVDNHSGGAKAAKVVDTIDRVLRESLDEDQKRTWREGLKLIEAMSERSCGKSFVEATPEQRIAVLQALSDNLAMAELPEIMFFKDLKRLTVNAYYTSKIGILDELGYKGNTILDQFVGCKDVPS
jgi:glucoside 3-dehydrogenase (cytochrome c) hitch-hiker subunit